MQKARKRQLQRHLPAGTHKQLVLLSALAFGANGPEPHSTSTFTMRVVARLFHTATCHACYRAEAADSVRLLSRKGVCVYYCRTYYKAVCGEGRGTVKDMCYEVRRAEACVD